MQNHYPFSRNSLSRLFLCAVFFVFSLQGFAQTQININEPGSKPEVEINLSEKKHNTFFESAKRARTFKLNRNIKSSQSLQKGNKLRLQLFGNKDFSTTIVQKTTDINGVTSLTLKLDDFNYAFGYVILSPDSFLINVTIPELREKYTTRKKQDTGEDYLFHLDESKLEDFECGTSAMMVEEGHETMPVGETKSMESYDISSESISCVEMPGSEVEAIIDVLIVYTEAAESWATTNDGGIINTIGAAIASANQAADNNNLGITFTLVHSAKVDDYTEEGTGADLDALRVAGDNKMDEVHTLRKIYGADLVVLLNNVADGIGGIGYVPQSRYGNANLGFSVTKVYLAGQGLTFIHELGHNFGANHNASQINSAPGPTVWTNWPENGWTAGWKWQGSNNLYYSDIMTYASSYYHEDGNYYENIPYFSDPTYTHEGQLAGHATSGDNARTLKEIKHYIAKYSETAEYCVASVVNPPSLFISNVTFGSINNSTPKGEGYGSYSALGTCLQPGDTENMEISTSMEASAQRLKVWVDWNDDKIFDEQSELLYASTSGLTQHSFSITAPLGEVAGEKRMRIRLYFDGDSNGSTPCGTDQYGEIEDYTIVLGESTACTVATVPQNLRITEADGTNISLAWDPLEGVDSYELRYRETGTTTWNTLSNIVYPFHEFDVIENSTEFEVQVRSLCDGTPSDYSASVIFTSGLPDYCESGATTSEVHIKRVQFNTIDNISGNENGGYSDFTNISTEVSQGTTYTFSVERGYTEGNNYSLSYSVWIDFNQDGNLDGALEQVWTHNATGASPLTAQITIPNGAKAGPTLMRVSGKSSSTLPGSCEKFYSGEVEDYVIIIGEAQDCLMAEIPANLNFISKNSTSGTLEWDDVAGAIYDIRYRKTGTTIWEEVIDYPYSQLNINDLEFSFQYEAQVRSKCDDGSISAYSGSFIFDTDYCISSGGSPFHITRVELGDINNTSGDGGGYSNFTSISGILEKGKTYTITVDNEGSGYNRTHAAWIDYNQNGLFDEPAERVWSLGSSTASSVSGEFTIPLDANLEETRLRISSVFTSSPNSCGNYTYGEVEDYTVFISDPVVCEAATVPANLNFDEFTANTASFSWEDTPGAIYDIRYRKIGENIWLEINDLTDNSITLEELVFQEVYEIQVRSKCADNSVSEYTSSLEFSTDYCVSSGGSTIYITRVEVGDINNSSSGNSSGYTDFTSLTTNLEQGQTYTFTIDNSEINIGRYNRVWIDYNNNGSFEDPEEMIFDFPATTAKTVSGQFTVPLNTAIDQVRMRVSMKMYAPAPSACQDFDYGEVEDYTINLVPSGGSIETDLAYVDQPVNTEAGAILPSVSVELLDDLGNRTTSTADVTLSIPDAPGVLKGTLTVAAIDGIATFSDLSVELSGTYTLEATSGSLPLVSSNEFTISPAAANTLAFVDQPIDSEAGISFSTSVEILDAYNNRVNSGDDVTINLIDDFQNGGILSGILTVAAIDGLATFTGLSVDKTGPYKLEAGSGSLTAVESETFNISSAVATKLNFVEQPLHAEAGTNLGTVSVEILDAFDNRVFASTEITLILANSPVVLNGATSIMAVDGLATFNDLSVNIAGTYALEASGGLLTLAESNTFNINAASATQLIFIDQPQNAPVDSYIGIVSVGIIDIYGNQVYSEDIINLLLIDGEGTGANLSGILSESAIDGIATFSDLQVDIPGTYALQAYSGTLEAAESENFTITPCVLSSDPPIADVEILAPITAQCSVTELTAPTATDNCGGSLTGTSDKELPIIASTTITWTYTDGAGNFSTQDQVVTIEDISAPVVDLTDLPAIVAECSVTQLTPPTATDNCDGQVTGTTQTTVPITASTTITWTYTDGAGNSSTQNQVVTIEDTSAPIADVAELPALTAECSVEALTPPTATDNCDGQVTGTYNTDLPITASTTITWTYTDGAGNFSTQDQVVTIEDISAPIADVAELPALTAECSVEVLTAPTATDNCDGQVTGTTQTTVPITASTVITWTYTDGAGNFSTQDQVVTIEDISAPVADVATLDEIVAECSVTELTPPTATDNCDGQVTGTTQTTVPITGSTVITWTYTDGAGNSSTQNQVVTIEDTSAPVADVATLDEIIAECSVEVLTPPTATDNCDGQVTGTTQTTVPITASTTITWTYTDGAGNSSTQNQVVTIEDTSAPIADVAELPALTAECSVEALTAPTATDNCDGQVTGTTQTTVPITASTVITWTYTDGAGNFSTQNQVVTIEDTSAPIADVAELPALTAECSVEVLTPPTATDNCDGQVTGTTQRTVPITASTVITWTYTDGAGNFSTQDQVVTIEDTSAPIVDVAELPALTAECSVEVLTPPTATDNCDGQVTGTTQTTVPITASTVITWTYTDGAGNSSTQNQVVTIEDTSAPIADVAELPALTAECSVEVLTPPTATDNCDGQVTGTTQTTVPITASTVITWTYTDGAGNSSTQNQVVTIEDTSAPIADVAELPALTAECSVEVLTPPTATDNCDGQVTGTTQTTVPITASTTITWTYTDGAGNFSTQDQVVTIEDISAPVADVATLEEIIAECSVTELTAPTATDNCDGQVTGTHNAELPITASTTITWTYTDGAGNFSTQDQVVTIEDTTAPIANVAELPAITAECSVTELTAPTATDNCDGQVTGTHNADLPITASTVITWTYTDGAGNFSTQDQVVTIEDTSAPIADVAELPALTAECSVEVLTPPTATDNCDGQVMGTTQTTVPITASTTITWTYTDGAGNFSTQDQVVTIEDTSAPIADVAELPALTAECSVEVLTAPTATDNCDGQVTGTTQTTVPITASTVITWTYTDSAGNFSTQDQVVTIEDISAPVADVAALDEIIAECSVTELTAPTATDNCGGVVTVSHDATLPITANTTITWTYTDEAGNFSTQDQVVTIEDISAPVADVAELPAITAECSVTELTPPTATDNCDDQVTGTTQTTVPITSSTVITWTYTDGAGNFSTQEQVVTIEDTSAPIADVAELPALTAECSVEVLTPPTATDNCDGQVMGTTQTTVPITASTTITWTYTDGAGNFSTQDQVVTIEDTSAPIADVAELPALTAECSVEVLTPPTATDNCDGQVTGTTQTTVPITASTVITWTYTDGAGNFSTQEQMVTIEDTSAPIADVAELPALTAECSVEVLTAPTATDNCDGQVTGTTQTTVPITASTVITWTYTDSAGNFSTQDQVVTIEDISAPVADVAALDEIIAECSVTELTAPTATDNCGGVVTVSHDATLPITANTTITWTYTDEAGNFSTQIQQVVIDDTTAPVADVETLEPITAQCSVTELTAPSATDNCGGEVTVTHDTTLPIIASTAITWTYTDGAGNFSTQTQSVVIDDTTSPTIAAIENKIIEGDEFGNATLSDYTSEAEVSDNCDLQPTVSQNPAPGEIISGSTEVILTVQDNSGNSNFTIFTVVVKEIEDPNDCSANLLPVIDDITGPLDPVALGNPITLYASISDDNISYATWSLSTNGVNFIDQPKEAISGSLISKTFELPVNVYSIKLIIEDACGAIATSIFEYVVIYDPDGGFVTGRGWIHSPAGAYFADASLEGKASFGFVSKYTKGRNSISEVDGNTNFQFRNADFSFKSSDHDDMSLVISGDRATYKGVGAINGSGSYKFMVVAIDGDMNGETKPDRFRIKIWESNSDDLLYDNHMGESDNSDATTELEGGSIVIHKPKGKNFTIRENTEVEALSIRNITAYPNPMAGDGFWINFSSEVGGQTFRARMFDFNGRLLVERQIEVDHGGGAQFWNLDHSGWDQGVYILKLQGPSKEYQIQLMKN
jgi:hypothetical protein